MKTALLLVALVFQIARVPIAPGPRVSIEGVLIGEGNQPVAGAEVRAFWSPPPAAYGSDEVPRTISDKDGRFALRELGAGGYRLSVRADGYAFQEYGATVPGAQGANTGTVIHLSPGESKKDITIRLVSDGIISGRITSTNGTPLLGMEVYAFRKAYDATGAFALLPEGKRGETNDRGEYRITGVPPGKYYVRAASPYSGLARIEERRAQSDGRAAAAGASPGEYAAAFFPRAADSERGALVSVGARGESTNIDIALTRQPLYRIRGRVIDPASPSPAPRVMIGTIPARAEFVSGFGSSIGPYREDGTFELTDIAPGVYWVRAQLPGQPLTAEERQRISTPGFDLGSRALPPGGSALVKVLDADVGQVEITLVRDLSVSGKITVEGRTPASAELAAVKVELRQLLAGRASPMGALTMAAAGGFTYKNLPAGEFRLTLSGLPPDLYVKEGRLGNMDVLTQIVEIAKPTAASLDIVLAKGVEVTGTLLDTAGKPVANQQVVLIPEGMPNRPDLYKTVTADATGRFTIQGVAPGDYRAFAWKTLEPFRYFDPVFVREFEDQGTAVHVIETTRIPVTVKLIP